jgi:hypothetical protein
MKKTNKVNPLTHFNNLKAAAIKKAGGAMKDYKKSLVKAQPGIQVNNNIPDEYKDYKRFSGPLKQNQAEKLDRILGPNTPMISSPEEINKYKNIRDTQEVFMRNSNAPYEDFNTGYKKGGSVKRKKK